jgi:hypothetical protein
MSARIPSAMAAMYYFTGHMLETWSRGEAPSALKAVPKTNTSAWTWVVA